MTKATIATMQISCLIQGVNRLVPLTFKFLGILKIIYCTEGQVMGALIAF